MENTIMASRKQRNRKANPIVDAIMKEYQPRTQEDMQDAIKDIFGPMFESLLQGEMDHHLGYMPHDHGEKSKRKQTEWIR